MALVFRNYASRDAEATKNVCFDAITRIASNDYSPEQIAAWVAGLPQDLAGWDAQMRSRGSFVAITCGQVAGFADVGTDGYVDMVFVSPEFAKQGVGSALLQEAEKRAHLLGADRLSAHVSLTARSLFESHGFTTVRSRCVSRDSVDLMNFRMEKSLRKE